jgi:hypothetical protein
MLSRNSHNNHLVVMLSKNNTLKKKKIKHYEPAITSFLA